MSLSLREVIEEKPDALYTNTSWMFPARVIGENFTRLYNPRIELPQLCGNDLKYTEREILIGRKRAYRFGIMHYVKKALDYFKEKLRRDTINF